jgi:hypothetical protein
LTWRYKWKAGEFPPRRLPCIRVGAAACLRLCAGHKGIDTRTLQAYLGHLSINSTTRYAALALTDFLAVFAAVGAIIVIGIAVVILNTRS